MSTSEVYHYECGGHHWGCSVRLRDTMSTPGAYHDECGGYHEYIVVYSVHWGLDTDPMALSMTFPTVIMVFPWCIHDIPWCTNLPPMY